MRIVMMLVGRLMIPMMVILMAVVGGNEYVSRFPATED